METFIIIQTTFDGKGKCTSIPAGTFLELRDARQKMKTLVYMYKKEDPSATCLLSNSDERLYKAGNRTFHLEIFRQKIDDFYPMLVLCKEDLEGVGFDILRTDNRKIKKIMKSIYSELNGDPQLNLIWRKQAKVQCEIANMKPA